MQPTFLTNLRGRKGDKGDKGDTGDRGAPGTNGVATDNAIAENLAAGTSASRAALDAIVPAAVASRTKLGRILTVGSSIGVGVGTTTPANDAYPYRMQAYLTSRLPGMTFDVTNMSVSGESTDQFLTRLPSHLSTYRPQVVTMECSVNDAALTKSITSDQTVENIRAAWAMCRLYGAQLVVLTHQAINPAWFNDPTKQSQVTQAKLTATRKLLLDAAPSMPGLVIVDIFKGLLHQVGTLSDGLHPNTYGANQWGFMLAEGVVRAMNADRFTLQWRDDFERTSATTLGTDWAPYNSTVWGADGASAYCVTGTDGAIVHRTVPADVDFTADMTWASGVKDGGILVRSTGGAQGYLATYTVDGSDQKVVLYSLNGAGATELVRSVPLTMTAVCTLSINVTGSRILVCHNEEPVLSAVDGTWAGGTKAGLRRSANDQVRWVSAQART